MRPLCTLAAWSGLVALAVAQGPYLGPPTGEVAPIPSYGTPDAAASAATPRPLAQPGGFLPAEPVATPPQPAAPPPEAVALPPAQPEEWVVGVRIVGNRTVKEARILPHIRTRVGRPFRTDVVEEDVRRLSATRMFVDIKTATQQTPGGRIVIFEVVERPTLRYVKFIGNDSIRKKVLLKESGLAEGEAADPFAVEEARRAVETFYHEKGFGLARVTIHEGDKPGDQGAVFVVHEGPKQRIGWTDFVGNTIADDARLRTQVQSKQGFLWVFKGEYDQRQIEEDKERLTAYYRSLGFFHARVGAEVSLGEDQKWAHVTFIIDEGPRYAIRDVYFAGNTKFSTAQLGSELKLRAGKYFNQNDMDADVLGIQETYGSVGYIFADVQAQPRFLEEPGQLDLVYSIKEGGRYRVGRIEPVIKGEYPHTMITTVLNRISLRPGDIVDIRELKASERRLRACGLFEVNPQGGAVPKIVFSPNEIEDADPLAPEVPELAQPPRPPERFRGQSPDESSRGPYPRPLSEWSFNQIPEPVWFPPEDGGRP